MPELNLICDSNLLYHYTALNTALIDILPNNELRFSPYNKTNDPKESIAPKIMPGVKLNLEKTESDPSGFIGFMQKNRIINDMFSCYTKVICFSKDHNEGQIIIKGYNLPTMWAHYGDCHKGVCLVFKKNLLFEQIKSIVPSEEQLVKGDVKYESIEKCFKKAVKGLGNVDLNNFKGNSIDDIYEEYSNIFKRVAPFFFIKRKDWISEREYRFIITENKTDYTFFDFGDALHQIILGSSINDRKLDNIKNILKNYKERYPNVQIHKMSWISGNGEFNPGFSLEQ